MIFDRHVNMKYKYGNGYFWFKGYFIDTVEKNEHGHIGVHKETNRRKLRKGVDEHKRKHESVHW